jgi:hypothetical protein
MPGLRFQQFLFLCRCFIHATVLLPFQNTIADSKRSMRHGQGHFSTVSSVVQIDESHAAMTKKSLEEKTEGRVEEITKSIHRS